eukprot:9214890-Prorocentrum_lima.AAC.1
MDTQLLIGAIPCRTPLIRSASWDAPHQVSRTKECPLNSNSWWLTQPEGRPIDANATESSNELC